MRGGIGHVIAGGSAWFMSVLVLCPSGAAPGRAQDAPAGGAVLGVARYGVADWPEAGRGNHRAVVRVRGEADAVRVHIPWRRRDLAPETKAVLVYDGATGKPLANVVAAAVSREAGEVVFQPASGPGQYEVYYLPYDPPRSNFDAVGEYYPPRDTADPAWRARNGLAAEALARGAWRGLPEAELVEIQARGEFHRFDPMEVIATAAETRAVLAQHPEDPYFLFPEDRRNPIRMTADLPVKWVQEGPRDGFAGTAQPNEYYVFQVGLWAGRGTVVLPRVEYSDLEGEGKPAIPASAVTCFNLEGVDWLGRAMQRRVTVPEGRVQALWFGVQVPRDASGLYRGTLTLRPEGLPPRRVRLELQVAGTPLEDCGDSDLWRLSRLRWLNSTLGLDDTVVPPFTPIVAEGDTFRILGRDVSLGGTGLPRSLVSTGREILAGPAALVVETERGPAQWVPAGSEETRRAPGTVERRYRSEAAGGLAMEVDTRIEADGCLTFRAAVKASRETLVRDIRLELPLRREIAVYFMGMGRRGGLRPPEWRWAWDLQRANNMVWLGDADAGVQLKLMGPTDVWDTLSLKDSGLPPSWSNGGQGGCLIAEEGDAVLVRAFSGERTLPAGEPLEFRFRLLVTPFRPIDPNHWSWRYGSFEDGGSILHLHHGTWQNPYINYPFLTADRIRDLVRSTQAQRLQRVDPGELSYPAEGNLRTDRGALHVWARVLFDPTVAAPGQARYNQGLFALDFPNRDSVGFYWNIDDHGMRAYVREGPPERNRYPVLIPSRSPDWRQGQRHLLTLSWGERFEIFVDGKRVAAADYRGLLGTPLDGARLVFRGGFALDAVKISAEPYREGDPVAPQVDPQTLLLDTFSAVDGNSTRPERAAAGTAGAFTGVIEMRAGEHGGEVVFSARDKDTGPKGVNVYYTLGQISNYTVELWALRSLGDEVLRTTTQDAMKVGDTEFGVGGGYAWLREHLVSDYVVGWRQPLPDGSTDAAISTQGLSRWHNHYLEGLDWLMRCTGVDGLYLDGIGYDREIMKRVAKVMTRVNPASRRNFHGGDGFSPPWDADRRVSTANANMEHFPYLSSLWFGELFDYDRPPDYWLVEISGIPFGLTGEMLNYENGGNPYRGMIYGMTGRLHPSAPGMWRFWDEFGIREAEMLGYWDRRCPVRTDDAGVLATVYRKPGTAAIALAHWPAAEAPLPVAAVAAARRAPVADGTLSPGEWDGAARLVRFHRLGTDEPPALPCEVFVTHDAERLYVGWRCATGGADPRAAAAARDGAVYEDDAVELFLQPDPADNVYFHFVGNSRGVFYDGKMQDASWNGPWEYRAAVQRDSWQGELSLPLAALGLRAPAGNAELGFAICRDLQTPRRELSSWAPLRGTYHDPQHFGRLRLGAETPTVEAPPGEQDRLAAGVSVRLKVDWPALGLDPVRTRLRAPAIAGFQPAAEFSPTEPIPVERGRGWVLVASEAAPGP